MFIFSHSSFSVAHILQIPRKLTHMPSRKPSKEMEQGRNAINKRTLLSSTSHQGHVQKIAIIAPALQERKLFLKILH